jgi:hypothetical protein
MKKARPAAMAQGVSLASSTPRDRAAFAAARRLALLVALSLSTIGLGACGGGGARSDMVAQVGSTPITSATLDHWTATFIRGDYYSVTRKQAPAGLASDPPNYPACVSGAMKIAAQGEQPAKKLTPAQLNTKCHQLYATVKREALSYLISVIWSAGQAAERGFKITEADITDRISQLQDEGYPKPGQFADYLTSKGWSRADLRYIVKRNLLTGEVMKALNARAGKGPDSQPTLVKLLQNNARVWTAKTSCRAGLVVEQCKEYKGVTPSGPSAAVLFEQMGSRTR